MHPLGLVQLPRAQAGVHIADCSKQSQATTAVSHPRGNARFAPSNRWLASPPGSCRYPGPHRCRCCGTAASGREPPVSQPISPGSKNGSDLSANWGEAAGARVAFRARARVGRRADRACKREIKTRVQELRPDSRTGQLRRMHAPPVHVTVVQMPRPQSALRQPAHRRSYARKIGSVHDGTRVRNNSGRPGAQVQLPKLVQLPPFRHGLAHTAVTRRIRLHDTNRSKRLR